jgi:hypothetical protein
MADEPKLPPGATIVPGSVKLPPGAKMFGPSAPQGIDPPKSPTLPEVTNKDIARLGKYLPAVAATTAAIFQPELLPAVGWLGSTAAATGLAAGGGALGSVAEQGLEVAAGSPGAPKNTGEFMKRLGKEGLEQGAYEAGGRAIAAPFGFMAGMIGKKLGPQSLMQGAIKPSTRLEAIAGRGVPGTSADEIVGTAIREGIPPSREGYGKLLAAINETTAEIDKSIAAKSPNLGAVISPQAVAKRLDALVDFYENQAAPAEDIAIIKGVRDQFLGKHSVQAPFSVVRPSGPQTSQGFQWTGKIVPTGQTGSTTVYNDLTLAEAQAEKRGTQRFNASSFGTRGTARAEAEKSLAYGLKEQIVNLFPEVTALNTKDSAMLALEDELRRFVIRQGNKNVIGLIPAVAGGVAGAWHMATGSEGQGTGELGAGGLLALSIMAIDNPEIKGKLAIALARAAKNRVASGAIKITGRLGKELPSAGIRAGMQ